MELVQSGHGVALHQQLVAEIGQDIEQHGIAETAPGLYQVTDTEHEEPMGGDVGVTVEELAVSAAAHGVHPQQHLLQKFTGIQRIFFSVIVLICFLDHIVQVGHNGIVGGLQSCEVGIIIQAPPVIEPLQHQFDGVDVTVGEVLVGLEEVFQE